MLSVKRLTRALVAAFVFMCLMLGAHTQAQAYQGSPSTSKSMVQWITEQTKGRVDAKKASTYIASVMRWSKERDLDPMLVVAIMRHESYFNANAKSPMGAQGLMQVLGKWHREKIKGRSLLNPEVNIEVGTLILKECWDRFDGHTYKALGCYLGGSPTKYFKNIQATHVALRHSFLETQWAAEEPIRETPKLLYASLQQPKSGEPIPTPLQRTISPAAAKQPPSLQPVVAPRVIVGDPLMHMASAALLMKQ